MSAIEAIVTAEGPDGVTALGAGLWEESSDSIRSELEELDAASVDAVVPLTVTRRTLVARRQWEILAAELPGSGPVGDRISKYRVGAETIRDEAVRREIRSRLREIVDAASKTVVATASANDFGRWGDADSPKLKGRFLQLGIRTSGRFGVRRLLAEKKK